MLAFDGLDPRIVSDLMARGRLPNFAAVARQGALTRLATTTPPHTPVAFSSIISGCDPGTHGVFDFIHRDPNPKPSDLAIRPYFSTSDFNEEQKRLVVPVGKWRLPLREPEAQLLRRGPAFWELLSRHGVETQVYYIPANYPPPSPDGPGRFAAISGMGAPDLLGGYGEFTVLTTAERRGGRTVDGGRIAALTMRDHHAATRLVGPPNFLRKPPLDGAVDLMTAPLRIVRDPERPVAMIQVSNRRVVLRAGEWSGWIEVDFRTGVPGAEALQSIGVSTSVRGIVRFLLKQVHPELALYISPINLDPLAPAVRLSTPPAFASELARRNGRFSTLGIPQDAKALSQGVLTEDEFLEQTSLVARERAAQYHDALARFKTGCMFFYFGESDLIQHMFWRDRDPDHPGRDSQQGDRYAHVIEDAYVGMDHLVADGRRALSPNDTMIILSDHGFTTFRRSFNLNAWLIRERYLAIASPRPRSNGEAYSNVDWSATRAYGLGMNGLYLNQASREKHGRVGVKDRRGLLERLRDELLAVRDVDGSAVIDCVDIVDDLYPNADPFIAPDLILGYADSYRASWTTVLGAAPTRVIQDNLDRWSGTHLTSARIVPGVLAVNRPVAIDAPRVADIAPSILDLFGIPAPAGMSGRSFFL